jgi:hypothetical protein
LAARRWRSTSEAAAKELIRHSRRVDEAVSFSALAGLPPPVERYLRKVLREGQPLIRSLRMRQAGEFRSRETDDVGAGWRPFEAVEVFTVDPPGFLWDATIRMAPLAAVRVRDQYVAGTASMLGAVLGIVPVVKGSDGPELRAGALQRYLGESVWFPTALLPRAGLAWTPLDDAHARATLGDGDTSVSLDFEFAPGGEIVSGYTAGRQRAGDSGRFVTLPWGGRYAGYRERDGMLVPDESEVFWVVGGREQPYYRGRNLAIEFHFGEWAGAGLAGG